MEGQKKVVCATLSFSYFADHIIYSKYKTLKTGSSSIVFSASHFFLLLISALWLLQFADTLENTVSVTCVVMQSGEMGLSVHTWNQFLSF